MIKKKCYIVLNEPFHLISSIKHPSKLHKGPQIHWQLHIHILLSMCTAKVNYVLKPLVDVVGAKLRLKQKLLPRLW